MAAKIPDVSDLDHQVVTRLPLDIQRLIHRIGKLVRPVVIGEGKKRDPT